MNRGSTGAVAIAVLLLSPLLECRPQSAQCSTLTRIVTCLLSTGLSLETVAYSMPWFRPRRRPVWDGHGRPRVAAQGRRSGRRRGAREAGIAGLMGRHSVWERAGGLRDGVGGWRLPRVLAKPYRASAGLRGYGHHIGRHTIDQPLSTHCRHRLSHAKHLFQNRPAVIPTLQAQLLFRL